MKIIQYLEAAFDAWQKNKQAQQTENLPIQTEDETGQTPDETGEILGAEEDADAT